MKTPALKEINDLQERLDAAQANVVAVKDQLFTKLERYARDLKGSPVLAAPRSAPVAHTNGSNGNGAHKPVKAKAKTSKVPVMYRNPSTGDTWSGRGRPARWLAEAVKKGAARESFRVGA